MKPWALTVIGLGFLVGAILLWILFLSGSFICLFLALLSAGLGVWVLQHPTLFLVESKIGEINVRSVAAQLADEFGVPVRAEALADGRKVADVIHDICHLLNAEQTGETTYVPLHGRAEDAVRQVLSKHIGAPPDSVRMDAHLASILPNARQRRASWRALRKAFGPSIDPLETPPERTNVPGCAAYFLVAIIMVVVFSISAIRRAVSPAAVAALAVGLAIAIPTILFIWIKRARALIVPLRYCTVGDLVPDALQRVKRAQDTTRPTSWSMEEVALRTREILSINARVPLHKVSRNKVLGKDIRTA